MTKLHIGCGTYPRAGWINIDKLQLPGVDRVLDIREGLPFENVDMIYGEHLLEQLPLVDGLSFMREARRVLNDGGVLRLTTPNLDWVWASHYAVDEPGREVESCLNLNRAFHGWGIRFLYNRKTLISALRSVGFAQLDFCEYGRSVHPELRDLERHLHDGTAGGYPALLVVEASGRAPVDEEFPRFAELYMRDMGI
jgi:predicted SAM-dependent methyltransferase